MPHFDEPPEPDFYEMAYLDDIAERRKRCAAEIESLRAERDAIAQTTSEAATEIRAALGRLDPMRDRYDGSLADSVRAVVAERDEARAEVERLEQLVCDFQAASMLEGARTGDPSMITPKHVEQEIAALRAETERLRDVLAPFAAVYRADLGDDFDDDELLSPEIEARHLKRAAALNLVQWCDECGAPASDHCTECGNDTGGHEAGCSAALKGGG